MMSMNNKLIKILRILLTVFACTLSVSLVAQVVGGYLFSRLYALSQVSWMVVFKQLWLPILPGLLIMLIASLLAFLRNRWVYLLVFIYCIWVWPGLSISPTNVLSGFEYAVFFMANLSAILAFGFGLIILLFWLLNTLINNY